MRHVEEDDGLDEIPGQNSFLDVITNIVGILILLVVVVGLRTSRAASGLNNEQAVAKAISADTLTDEELNDAVRNAAETQNDVRDLVGRMVGVHGEAALRERERNLLTTYVAAAEQEINHRRSQLTVDQQRDFDLRRQLTEAQQTLDRLTREQVGLMSRTPDVEVIENHPTPLARAVPGKAVYLQLLQGHVAIIPAEELFEELKTDLQQNIWRLKDQDRLVRTVGPVDGFRLRYYLRKRTVRMQHGMEFETQSKVPDFTKFEVIPVMSPMGDTVDQALDPNSELSRKLQKFPPDMSAVEIVVYPDSLKQLRTLKKHLVDAGYAIAESPARTDELITGSPHSGKLRAQ